MKKILTAVLCTIFSTSVESAQTVSFVLDPVVTGSTINGLPLNSNVTVTLTYSGDDLVYQCSIQNANLDGFGGNNDSLSYKIKVEGFSNAILTNGQISYGASGQVTTNGTTGWAVDTTWSKEPLKFTVYDIVLNALPGSTATFDGFNGMWLTSGTFYLGQNPNTTTNIFPVNANQTLSPSTTLLITSMTSQRNHDLTGSFTITPPTALTYDVWRLFYGLSAGSEYDDPDNDGYVNFVEYTLGLNPTIANAAGADQFILTPSGIQDFPKIGELVVRELGSQDVFYQIMHSSDADSAYPDWEIFASRWKTNEWVSDYALEEFLGTNGEDIISLAVPAAYSNHAFKCVVMDTDVYPEFSWDYMETWTFPRRPVLSQDGITNFTPEDLEFIASMGITCNGIEAIPETNGIPMYSQLADVLANNPNHKYLSYMNSAICYLDSYGGLSYSYLTYEDYCLWNELTNGWAISWTSQPRPYIDYRKPGGLQRQCDIAAAFAETGCQGLFMDALRKVGAATDFITNTADKVEYLEGYYSFLSFLRDGCYKNRIRLVNTYPLAPDFTPIYTGSLFTTNLYQNDEGLLNAYFNGLYSEGWIVDDKDELAGRMDWLINRWTRHGKLFLSNGSSINPVNFESMFELGVLMIVAGEHTYYRFGDSATLSYHNGGWANPTYWEFLGDRTLGKPLSEAARNGYVYTRNFEFAKVNLDLANRLVEIVWLNTNGTTNAVWNPAIIIGKDNFDGDATYLTRGSSATNNSSTMTWGIVNRSNVACSNIIDTSKYLVNGSTGDGTDVIGFLDSTKTDNFFGMYRANMRTLTYTFNIAGYTNLTLAMDWVVTGNPPDPGITVTASIDGRSAETILQVGTDPVDWTETMEDGRSILRDRNASVWVNGVEATSLTDKFQIYTPSISGVGSVLTITVQMASNTGGPAYGMDDLKVRGALPLP